MLERNNLRIFQDYFPNSHTHNDHQNPENMGEPHTYIHFHFLVISFSIYIFFTKVKFINKLSEKKFRNYPIISTVQTGLKSDWKRGLKRRFFAPRMVTAPNRSLWRSDLASNCCEIFSVAPGLIHVYNNSSLQWVTHSIYETVMFMPSNIYNLDKLKICEKQETTQKNEHSSNIIREKQ